MAFEQLKKTMESHGFKVSVFETAAEAVDYLNTVIDGTTVGCGGSVTIRDMGLLEGLATHNAVFSHMELPPEERENALKHAAEAETYILSANGIAEDTGEILNIDGAGNRVASSIYGHKRVFFVAGKNKISPDFHSALHRVRNVVAPKNARRLHKNTPCAVRADRCYDCNSPDRICCALSVHMRPMRRVETEVILINEELGF